MQELLNDLYGIAGLFREPIVVSEDEHVAFFNGAAASAFPGIRKDADVSVVFGAGFAFDVRRRCGRNSMPCYIREVLNGETYDITAAFWDRAGVLVFLKADAAPRTDVLTSPPAVSMVAASLREMLSGCFLAFGVLSDAVASTQRLSFYLAALRRNLFRILRLSHNLDFMAASLRDELELEPVCMDLAGQIRLMLDYVRPHASKLGLELLFDNRAGEIFNVVLDVDKMEMMLSHLLSNALKYTKRGGRITVSLDRTEKDVLLCVADNGQGIPHALMINIRRRFACEPDFADPEAGIGLGLSVVHEVVALHGGKIDMESCEDEGTQVYISIPYEEQIEPVDAEAGLRTRVLYNDGIPRLLIELSDVLGSEEYRL